MPLFKQAPPKADASPASQEAHDSLDRRRPTFPFEAAVKQHRALAEAHEGTVRVQEDPTNLTAVDRYLTPEGKAEVRRAQKVKGVTMGSSLLLTLLLAGGTGIGAYTTLGDTIPGRDPAHAFWAHERDKGSSLQDNSCASCSLGGEEAHLNALLYFYRDAVREEKGAKVSPEVQALRDALKVRPYEYKENGKDYVRYFTNLKDANSVWKATQNLKYPDEVAAAFQDFDGTLEGTRGLDLYRIFNGSPVVDTVKESLRDYKTPTYWDDPTADRSILLGFLGVPVILLLGGGIFVQQGRRLRKVVNGEAEAAALAHSSFLESFPKVAQDAILQGSSFPEEQMTSKPFQALASFYDDVMVQVEEERASLQTSSTLQSVQALTEAWNQEKANGTLESTSPEVRWEAMKSEEDRLIQTWLSYERDLNLRIQYPLMRDFNEAAVVEVVKTMSVASALRTPGPPMDDLQKVPFQDLEYPKAVLAFREAMAVAEAKAKHVGRSDFSQEDRDRLREAEKLLAMAQNEASSPAERRLCYERVIRVLENLEKPIKVDPAIVIGILEAAGLNKAITAA